MEATSLQGILPLVKVGNATSGTIGISTVLLQLYRNSYMHQSSSLRYIIPIIMRAHILHYIFHCRTDGGAVQGLCDMRACIVFEQLDSLPTHTTVEP